MKRKFAALKDMEKTAKVAFQKREGTHQSGGNVHGFTDGGNNATAKKKRGPVFCPLCGKKGHKTKKSKHCTFNPINPECDPALMTPANSATAALTVPPPREPALQLDPMEAIDADDADAMDTIPFTDNDDSASDKSDCETMEFHDAGTWSEDDEGDVVRATIQCSINSVALFSLIAHHFGCHTS